MKRVVQEKIYVILNLALHKQYVGRTRNLDSRYSDHVSKLRAGRDENPDLQRDWGRDGEENFIWVDVLLRAGALPPNILEDLLIDTLGTVDPALGYNGMTSRGWSSHARLRDMERKVIRARKFQLRPGGSLDDPIMESYLETVWKGHGKENREQPKREESEEQRDAPEEHEEEGEARGGPGKCEEGEEELRDGEEGEGWEDTPLRVDVRGIFHQLDHSTAGALGSHRQPALPLTVVSRRCCVRRSRISINADSESSWYSSRSMPR